VSSPLLRPRWIVGTVLVTAIVGGCITAGFWQLRRLDERKATNARIRERSAQTVPLPPAGFSDTADPDGLVFRKVRVEGTYDATHEVLVRFRSRRGLPGYEVVTPFRPTGAAGTLLVDRGWVPLADGDRWPVRSMAPPTGEVEVTGLLAPHEGGAVRLERRQDGPAVIAAIDPPKLRSVVAAGDDPLYAVHLLAQAGAGDEGASYPVPVDPPDLSEGPHRSYAVQWFLFASVGIIGWAIVLRRQWRSKR
jgi:cytochrome oxidase assembly protein ShyY1